MMNELTGTLVPSQLVPTLVMSVQAPVTANVLFPGFRGFVGFRVLGLFPLFPVFPKLSALLLLVANVVEGAMAALLIPVMAQKVLPVLMTRLLVEIASGASPEELNVAPELTPTPVMRNAFVSALFFVGTTLLVPKVLTRSPPPHLMLMVLMRQKPLLPPRPTPLTSRTDTTTSSSLGCAYGGAVEVCAGRSLYAT